MALYPLQVDKPYSHGARISTAKADYDGTGAAPTNLVPILTAAGALGGVIDVVSVAAVATVAAGVVVLWRKKASQASWQIVGWVQVVADTGSTTDPPFYREYQFPVGLSLDVGDSFGASTTIGQGFDVSIISGGDF
jgi:hypothetical protein